jgi:hypothetical protein
VGAPEVSVVHHSPAASRLGHESWGGTTGAGGHRPIVGFRVSSGRKRVRGGAVKRDTEWHGSGRHTGEGVVGDGGRRQTVAVPFWVLFLAGVVLGAAIAGTVVGLIVGGGSSSNAAGHTITYSVTGCCDPVDIVFGVPTGSGQRRKAEEGNVALPWSKTVIASGALRGYRVSSGPGVNGGTVTCTVSEDGTVLNEHTAWRTAGGGPATATCALPGS